MGLAVHCFRNLDSFSSQTSFYYREEVVTREQMQDLWENTSEDAGREIESMVLFRTRGEMKVANPNLNRKTKAEVMEAAGDMRLILPGKLMMGSFVSDSDELGCVISKKTAEDLFSSYEVLNQILYLEEESYYIRGVLDLKEELCVVQGARGTAYPSVRVDAPGLPLSAVQQLLAGILPSDYEVLSEGILYCGIGRIFLWFPAWVVLFYGIHRGRKQIRRLESRCCKGRQEKVRLEIFKVALPVISFSGICGILLGSFSFSNDYIPTSWSDFAFWTELLDQKWSDFLGLAEHQWSICDSVMLSHFFCTFGASVMCGILLVIWLQEQK